MSGYKGPGRYLHYKGGEYEVIGLALRENSIDKDGGGTAIGTGERFVIYRPLTPGSLLETANYGDCEFWARELGDFEATVPLAYGTIARFVYLPCRDCEESDLIRVKDHPENREDWSGPGSSQSYRVYRCRKCGDYWGCRHQWDAGTGHDDRWHRFGAVDPVAIRRHY